MPGALRSRGLGQQSPDSVATAVAIDETPVLVQPVVRLKAESLGAEGEAWLAALPEVVAELEGRWSVRVEASLAGGTAAYVARARADDGGAVIMKICVPDPDFGDEIGTIARARGRGYVQLLASDLGQHAMLLEDLGHSMSRTEMSPVRPPGVSGGPICWKDAGFMGRPSKYSQEFRERAVRLVLEQRGEYPSEFEAIRSVAAKLGVGDTRVRSAPTRGVLRVLSGTVAAIGLSLAITGCSQAPQPTPAASADSGTATDDSLSPSPSPAPAGSTIPSGGPPPPGLIVFTKAGGRYADDTPFLSRLDGTHERQLTPAGVTCCIRLSPDRRSILGASVTKDDRITVGIFLLSGGRPRDLPLPPGTLSLGPGAWAFDGQQIVVQGWDDSHQSASGMYLVDSADGGHRVRLTHEPLGTNDIPGDVSPDGRSLVFLRERADRGEATSEGGLLLMRLDGSGGIRKLVPSSFLVGLGSMRFSPDGKQILFQDGRTSPRGALWTIRPDGSHLTKIFDQPDLFASHPTWSPDGSQTLFALNPVADFYTHPENAFYVMNADGSGLRRVGHYGPFKREAEWFTRDP